METQQLITPAQLLEHWKGHRDLTRRVIEAFPEDKLLNYSIGGMRTFAQLAHELLDLADTGVQGMATGNWESRPGMNHHKDSFTSKQALLAAWDETTKRIDEIFPQITDERWLQVDKAFGQFENTTIGTLMYFLDNENHHRGQGYVYLRSLGIEPPAFWDRVSLG